MPIKDIWIYMPLLFITAILLYLIISIFDILFSRVAFIEVESIHIPYMAHPLPFIVVAVMLWLKSCGVFNWRVSVMWWLIFQIWVVGSQLSILIVERKRKRSTLSTFSPCWQFQHWRNIYGKNLPVSSKNILSHTTGKDLGGGAMKKFRCGIGWDQLVIYNTGWFIFRVRIRSEWLEVVSAMDSSEHSSQLGQPITKEEYHRIALTIAYAISNACD